MPVSQKLLDEVALTHEEYDLIVSKLGREPNVVELGNERVPHIRVGRDAVNEHRRPAAAHRARTRGVVGRGRTRRRAAARRLPGPAGRGRRMRRGRRPRPGAGGSGNAPPRRTER